jgi:hypothetical protein
VFSEYRWVCCPLMVWLSVIGLSGRACALQVIVTVTGKVESGTNGNPDSTPPGVGKVFGGAADLTGQSFTLTLNFDTSQGTSNYGTCSDGSVYNSSNVGAFGAAAGPTAVLQIGGGSYSFGTLPLSGDTWTITRSAPAACTSPYSEIGFAWGEHYAGNYAGASGLGGINMYPASLPSGDWRSSVPPTAVNATFHFTITLSQNGTLLTYAFGYLLASSITVGRSATCNATPIDEGLVSNGGLVFSDPEGRRRPEPKTCSRNNMLVSRSFDSSGWHVVDRIISTGEFTVDAGEQIAFVSSSDAAPPTLQFYFTAFAYPIKEDGTNEDVLETPEWFVPVEYPGGPVGSGVGHLIEQQLVIQTTFPSSAHKQRWTLKVPSQEDTHGNFTYYELDIYVPN